jgi:hypothetical protein
MKKILCAVALAALCLGPPVPAAKEKESPATNKVLAIPYRLTIPKHILVRAKINGKGPFNFILDTGAPALFIASNVGKKVGLKPDDSNWATVNRFEIEGGAVVEKIRARVETPFQLEGMNGMGLAGVEVHGLIGYNVLARFRMEIDFAKDKMVWTPLNYKPPQPKGMRGTGGGQGGLEIFGSLMKALGGLTGAKANPDFALRGFLGITVEAGDEYPTIRAVLENGPAAKAGVKVGDTLIKLGGRGVYEPKDVDREALKVRAGEPVEFTVLRGKDKVRKKITVTVGGGL